ncbi:hypothetical protein HY633_05075 [Candidatus Uhrbacteria bacterium]|nr:hypothetical protein [Candidatus Uhrbacteria bacterium]
MDQAVPASWPQDEKEAALLESVSYNHAEGGALVIRQADGSCIFDYDGDKAEEILAHALQILGDIDVSQLRDYDGPPMPPPPMAEMDLSALDQEGDFF